MQIWNPNSGKHVPLSRLLNPFESGPWGGLASGPALHACLSHDVPLPMDSDQVQLHFSGIECMALEGRPAPVIVATAVLQRKTAVHWLLDGTDPVTWRAMDAWDEQRGCQVLASHDGEEHTVALGLQLPDKVHPGRMFPELRDLCGHELTACFLHASWHALHRQRLERRMARQLKAKNRDLTHQSVCIVATPRVAEFAAAQPTAYVGKRA
ncbi:hypothetical protein ACQKRQ_38245 [Paraburkholderia sp. NPDC080076]|uniref:hypothetical protein n=1 Tax=Paraburkholderia sp. NPDC080076 TaxID=3390605 RepID=UPI003D06D24D